MKELISNRRVSRDYEILETLEAGLVLIGSEVKSLRNNRASLQESYVSIEKREAWLKGMLIPHYAFATNFLLDASRPRKLLLHHKEIVRLKKQLKLKGYTLLPLSLYLKSGRVKLRLGLAKGKKLYDKRRSIKESEQKKSIQRALKEKRFA